MLRSEPMKKVTLLAARNILVRLVHVLQSLGRVQLVTFTPDGEGYLRQASSHNYFPAEGYLVTLRSVKDYLKLAPPPAPEPIGEAELMVTLPDQMEALSAAVQAVRERGEALRAEITRLDREISALEPFADLPLDLRLLSGYETLRIFAVQADKDFALPQLPYEVHDIFRPEPRRQSVILRRPVTPVGPGGTRKKPAPRILAVAAAHAEALRAKLNELGLSLLPTPASEGEGPAGERLAELRLRRAEAERELAELDAKRGGVAREWRDFVFAAEEALVALLAKNLGSTNFAVSSYVVAGSFWARERELGEIRARVRESFPVGVEFVVEEEISAHEHEPAEVVPTTQNYSRWTRPFAVLTEMFSVPRYDEIDPTAVMAICFPLFFGFMIGDAGYGLGLALIGWYLGRKLEYLPGMEETRSLCRVLMVSGICGLLFGLFVFADFLGVPFQGEEGAVFWWGRIVPGLPHPLLLKTEGASVTNMLILSILVGWFHMGLGCVFGIINELPHSRRHALGKLGQLAIITGFVLLISGLEAFRGCELGALLWDTLLRPVELGGAGTVNAVLLLSGLVLVGLGEGPLGLIEFFGLFGNVVSFTRLALVGVSKAAVAIAVNTVLIPQLLAGGGAIKFILFAAVFVVAHLALVLLGGLSASIQAVRLHYCETFAKFFHGGGMRFAPFGIKRVYTRS